MKLGVDEKKRYRLWVNDTIITRLPRAVCERSVIPMTTTDVSEVERNDFK